MLTPQIFISYRRDDAAGYARAIGDALGRQFGPERVFIDVDDIAAGQRFDEVIHQAVDSARVLLVLIGRRWLGERAGQPARIHDAGDLVACEVAAALAGRMQVIPLLLDGALMPEAAQLPPSLQALTGLNALAIDNNRFADDLARLLAALRPLDRPAPAGPALALAASPPRTEGGPVAGRRWALGAAALGLLGLVLGLVLWSGLRPPAARLAAAARPPINGPWQAEVAYDWPNARFSERFVFSGDGDRLQGSASFLRVARSIDDGSIDPNGLHFVTHSPETAGTTSRDTEHRYQGRLVGDELRLTMQTVGASTPHAPVEIVARRAADAASR
jgi:hypothetical protein